VAQLAIDLDVLGRDAADIATALATGDPSIRVAQDRSGLTINPQFLQPGEVDTVITRLRESLAA
jgi:hypothetical protein